MHPRGKCGDFFVLESRRRRQHPFGIFAALHCIGDDEHVRRGQQRRRDRLVGAGYAVAIGPQQRGKSSKPSVDRVEVAMSGIDQHSRPGVGPNCGAGTVGCQSVAALLARGMSRAAAEQEQRNDDDFMRSFLAVRQATHGFSIGPSSMRDVATS